MKGVPKAGARTCGSSHACPECEGHIRRGESQDAIMTHRIRGFDAAAKFATLATPRAGNDENCEIAGVRASFGAIYRNRSAQTFV